MGRVNRQPAAWPLAPFRDGAADHGLPASAADLPDRGGRATITGALLPLYGPGTAAASVTAAVGGWLSLLTKVAVAALTGFAMAGSSCSPGEPRYPR